MFFHAPAISVETCDCLQIEEQEPEDDLSSITEADVSAALQHGHLAPEQALWLHEQHIDWQIDVKRS